MQADKEAGGLETSRSQKGIYGVCLFHESKITGVEVLTYFTQMLRRLDNVTFFYT